MIRTAMHVDLTLAVNYIPACSCLIKVLLLMLAVSLVPEGSEIDGALILAAMLYIDRLTVRNIIFDANAILLAIFFANIHASVRAIRSRHAYRFFVDGLFLFWACGSLILLIEPSPVKRELDKRPSSARMAAVFVMLLVVVGISSVYEPLESGGVRCCRAVAFALLSFAWIYIVGVHTTSGIEYLKENSCQFVSRLSPVLYAPLWIAGVFTIGSIAAFTTLHMRSVNPNHPQHYSPLPSSVKDIHDKDTATRVSDSHPPPPPPPPAGEQEDLEELFRLAQKQQAARKGLVFLDPIQESA